MGYAIIAAPSALGLTTTGVALAPEVLLQAELAELVAARAVTVVEPPPYRTAIEPETMIRNAAGIAAYAVTLADSIAKTIDAGDIPIVLGGDCSILLGPLLALARRGRSELLFVDGHADFYQPEAEPNGEAASMELALATGHGHEVLTKVAGLCPLVRESDVIVVGRRDAEEADAAGSRRIEDSAIEVMDAARIREVGLPRVLEHVERVLCRDDLEGFWLHLDVDVLDSSIMPAVEYLLPGGLSWDEVLRIVRWAVGSDRMQGIDVTIFDPSKDADGRCAAGIVDLLVRGLDPSSDD